MKVIIKKPNETYGTETEIENKLKDLQKVVGGCIETFPVNDKILIICNGEGKIMGLPYNLTINNEPLMGTIIVVGDTGDDFTDIPITMDEWKKIVDKEN